MREVVHMLRRRSERFHMVIHVLCGIICGYFVKDIFPEASTSSLIFWGVLGSLLPDLDHFLYFYFYGRKTDYSQIVRKYIKDKKFRQLLMFWRFNHKKNPGLYTHNIFSIVLSLYFFAYFVLVKDTPTFSVFTAAVVLHFVFDLGEDLLFMKKLNPNWYFKYGKKPSKKDLVIP